MNIYWLDSASSTTLNYYITLFYYIIPNTSTQHCIIKPTCSHKQFTLLHQVYTHHIRYTQIKYTYLTHTHHQQNNIYHLSHMSHIRRSVTQMKITHMLFTQHSLIHSHFIWKSWIQVISKLSDSKIIIWQSSSINLKAPFLPKLYHNARHTSSITHKLFHIIHISFQ